MVYTETRPKGEIAAAYGSPGPIYSLPGLVGERTHDPRSVHNKQPAYSFGVRHGKWRDDASPGPIYLPDLKYSRYGADGSPRYSLYGRPRDLKNFTHLTPGPGTYKNENCNDAVSPRLPAYSFGARTRDRTTDQSPGPAAYSVPALMSKSVEGSRRQAPCYTLVGRRTQGGFHEDLSRAPGPGAYSVTTPGTYKRSAPSYSLVGRNMMPSDATLKPGPGAHSPENGKINHAPAFSFGVRHSPYVAPVYLKEDA